VSNDHSLATRASDVVASALKGTLGAIPFIGSAVAEVIEYVIPNQRIDRLTDFAKKLSEKVSAQERLLVQKRLLEPEGTDILEEALWQSARTISEERRLHIASLVKNGITKDQIDLVETKKLLLILSQLNDLEVILLRWHADRLHKDKEFEEKFKDIIRPVQAYLRAPQEVLDKAAISESLRHHLAELGLLKPTFPFVRRGEIPEFDTSLGTFKNSGYHVTLLGRLLLRSIDFHPEDPRKEETKPETELA